MKTRIRMFILSVIYLLFAIPVPVNAASERLQIVTDPAATAYFEILDETGTWRDLEAPYLYDADSDSVVYCAEHSKPFPEAAEYVGIADGPFNEKVTRGITNILEHGYPAFIDGFTEREAHYATANALRIWIYESADEGFPYMVLDNDRIRPKDGHEPLFDYMAMLVDYARNDTRLKRPWITLSRESTQWKYDGDGVFRAKVQVDLLGVNMRSYQLVGLPEAITTEGYTGNSGDVITFYTEDPMECAFSFSGNAAHQATHMKWLYNSDKELPSLVLVETETQNREPVAEFVITEPDELPTPEPTETPTPEPTAEPTEEPTPDPTEEPTIAPTEKPEKTSPPERTAEPTRDIGAEQTVQPDGTDTPAAYTLPIVISVVDSLSGAAIPGVEILVEDENGNYVYQQSTDNDGRISFARPKAGKYTFRQKIAPEGFQLNTTPFSFTVLEDGGIMGSLTMANIPMAASGGEAVYMTSTKTDGVTGEPIANVEIEIRKSSGEIIFTGMTNAQGMISFPQPSDGQYIISDIALPQGYAASVETAFIIGANGGVSGSLDTVNMPTEAHARNVDGTTGKEIADPKLELRLLDAQGQPVKLVSRVDMHGIAYYAPGSMGKDIFLPGQEAIIRYLPAGLYTLEEITPPGGYSLSPSATMEVTQSSTPNSPAAVTLTDYPLALRMEYFDSATGEAVTDGGFSIMEVNTDEPLLFSLVDGSYHYNPEGRLNTLQFDSQGELAVYYLPQGEYVMEETEAREGYAAILPDMIIMEPNHSLENPLVLEVTRQELMVQGDNGWVMPVVLVCLVGLAVAAIIFFNKRGNPDE